MDGLREEEELVRFVILSSWMSISSESFYYFINMLCCVAEVVGVGYLISWDAEICKLFVIFHDFKII